MKDHNGSVNEQADAVKQAAQQSLNEIGREARKHADDAKKEAVKGLNTAAEALRREAHEAGANREVLESVNQVARGLEQAAAYLRKHSYEDMGADVSRAVKGSPLRTLSIVFIIGLVVGLLLRGDSHHHDQQR
jgi:F0F1-type ATP synthase membrane subunit b/b'